MSLVAPNNVELTLSALSAMSVNVSYANNVTIIPTAAAGGGTSYTAEVTADSPVAYYRLGDSSGACSDETTNYDMAYSGSPTLGATSLVSGSSNTAVTFAAASSQYAEIDSALGLTYPFTFEAMVASTSDGTTRNIVSLTDASGSAIVYAILINNTDVIQMYTRNSTAYSAIGTTDLSTGAAFHIVAVWRSATDREVYVNGVSEGTSTDSVALSGALDRTSIGRWGRSVPTWYMDGTVDEVAIYNAELSEARITAHYDAIGNAE